jgi:YD repeat-containing protein
MRIRYDPEVDALSVIFQETTVTTKELADGIVAEYDAQDRLVGVEILDAGSRLDAPSTFREVILEGVGLAAPSGDRAGETS